MAYTKDVDETLVGDVTVYVGTAGTPASNLLGFLREDDAFDITDGPEPVPIKVHGQAFPHRHFLANRTGSVTLHSLQTNATLLGIAFGVTPSGQVITLDETPKLMPQISLAFVSETLGGTAWRRDWLYVSTDGMPKYVPTGKALVPISMKFNVEGTGAQSYITLGAGNVTATLATGVLTRTGNYHKVAGESAAADTLTNITAADLVNGETLTLQISATTMPITLDNDTATAGHLILTPGIDWQMTRLSQSITFQYVLADTHWTEIARYSPSV